jgi:hypothetical protein
MGRIVILRRSYNLGSGLPRRITSRTLRVAVVFLVLGTSPILDVVALALLSMIRWTPLGGPYSRS